MKITKRQLKRIIKEEKAKLLHETVADMRHMEEAADQAASAISDLFGQDMMKLYDEEPEAFARPDPNGTGMIRDSIEVWAAPWAIYSSRRPHPRQPTGAAAHRLACSIQLLNLYNASSETNNYLLRHTHCVT